MQTKQSHTGESTVKAQKQSLFKNPVNNGICVLNEFHMAFKRHVNPEEAVIF